MNATSLAHLSKLPSNVMSGALSEQLGHPNFAFPDDFILQKVDTPENIEALAV